MLRSIIVGFLFLCFAGPCYPQTADDLFDDSILQEIRVEVRPSDWNQLKEHYTEDTRYAADISWSYGGNWITVPQVAIRSRGNGSRSPVKPSLQVDFDRYNPARQFLGLQSLALKNNTQDPSMLRERMAFDLMRKLGMHAPRTAHARLYVNGEYMGLYLMVEPVNETFVRDRFHEIGYLYQYEYPWEQDPYRFQYRGADVANYCPSPFKPETFESAPQCEAIERLIRTMNEAPDEQFEESISEHLDIRGFLKEIGVEAYLGESDGIVGDFGLNNFFLYRPPNSERFEFVPWDKSQTLGLVDRWVWQNTDRNVLSRRALADPKLRDVFIDAITTAASVAGGPGGWLEQDISRAYAQIHEAALEDPNKQCPDVSGLIKTCTNDEFEFGVAWITSFARKRNEDVAEQISSYSIPDSGGVVLEPGGPTEPPATGYARIHADDSNTGVSGFAIFDLRQDNALVSETAVAATGLRTTGRVYAEINSPGTTGLAIANPNAEPAVLNFYFTDSAGTDFGQGSVTIPIGGQFTRFLNEEPFNAGATFRGSFTFTSSLPVSAIALLGFTNERGIFMTTTLTVIDLQSIETPSILPQFVDGGGWSTDLILMNPYDMSLSGRAEVVSGSSFDYSIPARASIRIPISGQPGTGWIRLASTGRLPVANGIFRYQSGGVTVTQAGIPAVAGDSAFRTYAEESGSSLRSGVAIANLAVSPAEVQFELTSLSGESTGLTGTITIPGYGHAAKFLDEIPWVQVLPDDFRGILRVSTGSGQISVMGFRSRYTEVGNFLITTIPPVSENVSPPPGDLFFPHWINSLAYSTQFVLYSSLPRERVGRLEYLSQWGEVLNLTPQE